MSKTKVTYADRYIELLKKEGWTVNFQSQSLSDEKYKTTKEVAMKVLSPSDYKTWLVVETARANDLREEFGLVGRSNLDGEIV